MIQTKKITYQSDGATLEGVVAYDDQLLGNRPVIIVMHDWSGRNAFAEKKAERLAEMGYVGFALDIFGDGKTARTKEEKSALIQPFMGDREILRQRVLAAFETAKQLEFADANRIGAIGFCFGGLCALDLARSGAALRGVVSFHGLLGAPEDLRTNPIKAKILVITGHDDPMVPPETVLAFENEMTKEKVDWQVMVYGNTLHAFTNPEANDRAFGTVYNSVADKRSWLAMRNFFEEVMV